MNTTDMLILCILGGIVYLWFNGRKKDVEPYENDEDYESGIDDKKIDKLFRKMVKKKVSKNEHKLTVDNDNDNCDDMLYVETQFNNDYRDTMTAFNNLAQQKQLFNKSELPVKFSNPKKSEVKDLVKGFIKQVNHNIKYEVTDVLNANSGWDELVPEKTVESGWDKQQKELGLPCSIYNAPAKKARINLVKLENIEKFATEEQVRYIIHMILQKSGVKDKMVVKVSFVVDSMLDERKFFDDDPNKKIAVKVTIEEIFILGFLIDDKMGRKKRDDFYDFDDVEQDGMMDQEKIIKQLMKKYRRRQIQSSTFDLQDPILGSPPDVINELALQKLQQHKKFI